MVEMAKVDEKLASARLEERKALLEQAEYQALAQNQDTRVRDMTPEQFQQAVSMRRAEVAKQEQERSDLERKVADARQEWESARSRMQAAEGGSQPFG
jgi:hypothetical protein